MLGESFVIELLYKEQVTCKKISNDEKETWKKQLLDIEGNSYSLDKMENENKVMKEQSICYTYIFKVKMNF